MSRIGKLPVEIPSGVTVTKERNLVKVESSKGILELLVNPKINFEIKENQVLLSKKADDSESGSLYGLTRTLISNMVKGVSEGFKKELEINGIGYRAAVSGNDLTLNLGYSHPIKYAIPENIHINVEKNNIIISGIDKQKVGQVAAEIRSYRKPEPYKGKGVKYATEVIRRKSGKTGTK
ncbi:MAG: 50S ribosomal protein L6 [Patescibacteria group bacterium]|jgi:large subunit ribosomal protein L6|nr:50S ribosomal protein L6 [Patescibacteria group bacterium]